MFNFFRWFQPAQPVVRTNQTVLTVGHKIYMPGIKPDNIQVLRALQSVTIIGEQYPFDILGDKYFEKYEIAKGKCLDSVVFLDGDVLELQLANGTPDSKVQQYNVSDLRSKENRNGNSSNTSSV